jgi:hypothetical protein
MIKKATCKHLASGLTGRIISFSREQDTHIMDNIANGSKVFVSSIYSAKIKFMTDDGVIFNVEFNSRENHKLFEVEIIEGEFTASILL